MVDSLDTYPTQGFGDVMANKTREVTAGLTDLQGNTMERVLLIHSTTQSALVRRALNEMFLRDGWLTIEQLAADEARP